MLGLGLGGLLPACFLEWVGWVAVPPRGAVLLQGALCGGGTGSSWVGRPWAAPEHKQQRLQH